MFIEPKQLLNKAIEGYENYFIVGMNLLGNLAIMPRKSFKEYYDTYKSYFYSEFNTIISYNFESHMFNLYEFMYEYDSKNNKYLQSKCLVKSLSDITEELLCEYVEKAAKIYNEICYDLKNFKKQQLIKNLENV